MRSVSRSLVARLSCSIFVASIATAAAIARGGGSATTQPALGADERAKSAAILVDQGLNALEANQCDAAVEALNDARRALQIDHAPAELDTDAHYIAALEGLVVAYIRERDFVHAGQLFKRGETLDKVCASNPPPGLLVNRAIVDIVQRVNVLRSAKAIAAAMEADAAAVPDEATLNLLGTALARAEWNRPISRGTTEQLEASYASLNDRLEASRPGMKRWGVRWVSLGEYQNLEGRRRVAAARYQAALRQVIRAQDQVAAAQWDTEVAHVLDFAWGDAFMRQKPYVEPDAVRDARVALRAAQERLAYATAQANAAQAAMPPVEWLADAEPVLPPRPLAGDGPGFVPDRIAAGADTSVSGPPPWVTLVAEATAPSRDRDRVVFVAPQPKPTAITFTSAPGTAVASAAARSRPTGPFSRYACAFPVDRFRLVTASAPLSGCDHVQIQDAAGHTLRADVIARDGALALLEIDPSCRDGQPLNYLATADRFVSGPVRCAALAEPNVFRARPALLDGHAGTDTGGAFAVQLEEHPRLPGAPLLTSSGRVVGVELSRRDDGHENLPAVNLATLRDFLVSHHAVPQQPSDAPVDGSSVFQVIATVGGDS